MQQKEYAAESHWPEAIMDLPQSQGDPTPQQNKYGASSQLPLTTVVSAAPRRIRVTAIMVEQ